MKCPECGVTSPATTLRCECGYNFLTHDKSPLKDTFQVKVDKRDRRYGSLYIYSIIIEISGWITIFMGIIVGLLSIKNLLNAIVYGVGGLFTGLMLIAAGQLMCVWRDTEENTRKIASLLKNVKIS